MALDKVCWRVKKDGATEIRRASEDAQLTAYMADGDQIGYLWKQGSLEGAHPE